MYYNNYYPAGMQSMTPQPQSLGLKGRPVSSLEEVRAAQIDFDGSLFVFPDIANKKIYTKQINLDGTAALKVYEQINATPPTPSYVTQQELEAAIIALQQQIVLLGKEDKNEPAKSKTTSNNAAISF